MISDSRRLADSLYSPQKNTSIFVGVFRLYEEPSLTVELRSDVVTKRPHFSISCIIIFMNILFGTSKKQDKQMRLLAGDEAMKNRVVFFSALKIDPTKITSGLLVHGKTVALVNNKNLGQIISDTDALVTNLTNACLTITIADCVPIFFIDKNHGAIGLAHAGWRGVLKKIAIEMIETMTRAYSSSPADIEIHFGPHILSCHFEVRANVAEQFLKYSDFIFNQNGKMFIDLQSIIKGQLIEAGVNPINIHPAKECTFCDQDYFSYRRDKPKEVESQVAYIFKRD